MRQTPRRLLPLLLLLAVPACATPPPHAGLGDLPEAAPTRLALNERLATRRGGSARPVALWAGAGPRCGSALDDPAAAQRLMAATRAEGPRDLEVPVMHCAPVFRAL